MSELTRDLQKLPELPGSTDSTRAPRIGGYAVTARLPGSPSNDVFLGYKVTGFGLIRRAVVKWADRTRPDYEEVRKTLIDEGRAISLVDHPNVVSILDLGEDEAGTFLAIEYVPGTDLRFVLTRLYEKGDRIPTEHATYVACSLLRGLASAHAATDADGNPLGLIHRDVNPSNVLVSKDGHVSLTDFGIVMMAERVQDKTAPRTVKGKIGYLAPEYITEQESTPAADVYGVGLTLFEMLCGRPAFSAPSPNAMMLKIVKEGPPLVHLHEAHIPPTLQGIVQQATQIDPTRRFASAMAMCNALEEWLSVEGPNLSSPSRFATYLREIG